MDRKLTPEQKDEFLDKIRTQLVLESMQELLTVSLFIN